MDIATPPSPRRYFDPFSEGTAGLSAEGPRRGNGQRVRAQGGLARLAQARQNRPGKGELDLTNN